MVLVPPSNQAMVVQQQPRRKRRSKKGNKPSKNFVKAVEKIIHKNIETKQAFHGLSTTSYNSGINSSGDTTKVVPSIAQGVYDNQRIGDQIKAQSLTIKGAVVYNPSAGAYGGYSNSRVACRLMVVQPRKYSNIDDVQSNAASWLAYLLKKGGSTSSFNGDLSDLWAPINSDGIIKYYDRIIYLDSPYQVTAVGSQDMKGSYKLFKIKMNCRNKLLKYDTNVSSGLYPTNYAPVVILGYAHMDGSSADTLTTAVQMTYDSIFNFEDA